MAAKSLSPEQLILKAAKAGNLAAIQSLLAEAPALARAHDEHGATPLHLAARKGHAGIAAALLAGGADVTAQWTDDHIGGTPLHAAAHGNQRAVAELLLQHGADPQARSVNGRSVLDETTFHNAKAVVNLLRKHGVG
jgi:ankyrin repeat protein